MPIYEYLCNDCEQPFEELVRSSSTAVTCPLCEGTHIERLMSVVNTHSASAEPTCMAEKAGAMPGGGCCGGGRCGLQ